MGRETLKARLRRIERFIAEDEDLPGAIIISVVDNNLGAPARDDERDCIGLLSCHGGPWKKIVRRPGESLDDMDKRAHIGIGNSIPTWLRVYGADEESERMELFDGAQEAGCD